MNEVCGTDLMKIKKDTHGGAWLGSYEKVEGKVLVLECRGVPVGRNESDSVVVAVLNY